MGTVITNLKAKFGVEGSKESKNLIDDLGNTFSDLDKSVGKSIDGLLSMLKPVALLAGAGGALSFLKSSIEAVEGPADNFEAAIGGGKEALFEMQRALISLDFTGFIKNIAEAFNRGKEFTQMLDELADKAAYSDYVVIGLQQEAEVLRETLKNKTLDISIRADAAEKIKDIELRIFQRRKDLLEQTYDIEKQSWEGRAKMSIDEGVKLFETINKVTKEGYNNVNAETIRQLKKLYEDELEIQKVGTLNLGQAAEDAAYLIKANLAGTGFDYIKNIPKEDLAFLVDTIKEFTIASEIGEKDVWVKLFEAINKNARELNTAQQEYNSAIGETTKVLSMEEKQLGKIDAAQDKINKKKSAELELEKMKLDQMQNGVQKIAVPKIEMPSFAPILAGIQAPVQDIKSMTLDLSATINSSFADMAVGVGEFFGGLMSGESGAGDFASKIGLIFANLAINVGKVIIAAAIAKGAIDKALTTFGGAGVALAAGIALVAVGSAMRGALQSAASGNGSSGSNNSFQGSPGNFVYDNSAKQTVQPINIHITGKLVGEGSTLAAVLDYESKRKNAVT